MYEPKLTNDIGFPTTNYIFPGQEIGRVTRNPEQLVTERLRELIADEEEHLAKAKEILAEIQTYFNPLDEGAKIATVKCNNRIEQHKITIEFLNYGVKDYYGKR